MQLAEVQRNIAPLRRERIEVAELEYIAFSGQHEIAHGIFLSIPKEERATYANKYILSEVITGGVKKLKQYLSVSAEGAANEEKEFIDETVELFLDSARASGVYSRELFESLLVWSDELFRLSLLQESLRYYDEALAMGVNKFPDLYVRSLVGKAGVLNTLGKFRETQSLLLSLAERPYVITDRNVIPELLFKLGKESLLRGEISFYKQLLFRGLRHFYTSLEDRKLFVEQIQKTYRRTYKVLFDAKVTLADKVLFLIHRLYFTVQPFAIARYTGLARALRLVVLGYVYCVNYLFRSSSVEEQTMSAKRSTTRLGERAETIAPFYRRRNILVTRAMGGIGDLLMMTPGFHALKKQYPRDEIHLAIPKRYFPIFQNNPSVTLVDIEHDAFEHYGYKKWYNFTDCPASRIEALTAPRVKKNRIELFARSLGLSVFAVRNMDKRPQYIVTDEERAFQKMFWREHGLEGRRVIGVQLHSDEVYRDYPHMEQVIAALARDTTVLVFDAIAINGCDGENIIKVAGMPMRKAFALASSCDAIVAPDSAFVHLAAAFDTPCVALYGPIDGALRTMHYPMCKYLDVRKKLGCMPCWRNDKIPCKLTNMRTSVCMADITINEIQEALTEVLQRKTQQ